MSDLTASQLTKALGVPSNLLAHRLSILRQAGLLRRQRSDADSRPSYLSLDGDHQASHEVDYLTPQEHRYGSARGAGHRGAPARRQPRGPTAAMWAARAVVSATGI